LWSNDIQRGKPQEPGITQSLPVGPRDYSAVQPRAIGAARLGVLADALGVTRLAGLRQSGSMRLVFPQTQRADIEAILVNTAGGITGGDQFDLEIGIGAGAALTLTTQAAERAYRAQCGEVGRVATRLTVHAGASLNWLPQELILYNRCALRRTLDIKLAENARLVMVEPVVFGRAAMQEVLRDAVFQDRIRIFRDGKPLYLDGVDLHGDVAARLARPAVANGAGAVASVVMVAPEASARLTAIRALLPKTAGASLLARDVLVIRILASDSFELRRSLIPALEHLTQTPLPTSWRL